jgi:hypothetical protein
VVASARQGLPGCAAITQSDRAERDYLVIEDIPRRRVPIQLTQATPTQLTPAALQKQLNEIGLTCPDTATDKLRQYIAEVKSQLINGQTQTYAILRPAVPDLMVGNGSGAISFAEVAAAAQATGRTSRLAVTLSESSVGNWEPDSTGLGYGPELEYIQFETHFDWLKANRPSFTGVVNNPPVINGKYDSVDAIKKLFVEVGTTASSTLVKGLDKASFESVLSNAIAPLTEGGVENYHVADSRVIFLVENYDPASGEADAVGVLTIWWELTIKDYKEKKQTTKHDTTLTIKGRSVLYSTLDALFGDYQAAKTQFNGSVAHAGGLPLASERSSADRAEPSAALDIPPRPGQLTIFDKLPPANRDTFSKSLPTTATADRLQAITLYAPDLQSIGSIDNTTSDATSSYSQSVTSGFTFSTTQTFSSQLSAEVSIEIVKAGLTLGFSLSFTETWDKSTTTTMEFSLPPGKKAFTYQGYMFAAIINFDAQTGEYSYLSTARCMTPVLATSHVPLTGPSKFTQISP